MVELAPVKFPINPVPAIRYHQGERQNFALVPNLDRLGRLSAPAELYDPLADPGTGRVGKNRNRSSTHVGNIERYLRGEPRWVLGSMTAYAAPGSVRFTPLADFGGGTAVGYVESDTFEEMFAVGDGGHRGPGIGRALDRKKLTEDQWRALVSSGIIVQVVEESDPAQAAIDFVRLGSTKPISSSLKAALDTQVALNRLGLALVRRVPVLMKGEAVQFLSEAMGQNAQRLMSFNTFRNGLAIVMAGANATRSPRVMAHSTEAMLDGPGFSLWTERLLDALTKAGTALPGWRELLAGSYDYPTARKTFLTCTSSGFFAVCGTLHAVREAAQAKGKGEAATDRAVDRALDTIGGLDWSRDPDKSFLADDLLDVDDTTGSVMVATGRPAWMAATARLVALVVP